MKKAFTMIELIFSILIIGFLAAISIPKLMATRDDAKHATLVYNTKICINDLIAGYRGNGDVININSSTACKSAKEQGANISYTSDAVRVSGVDNTINGDYIFKGSRISL